MLTDQLTEALTRAAAEQPFVPDHLRAVMRARNIRRRRTWVTAAGTALAAAGIVAGLAISGLSPDSSRSVDSLHPAAPSMRPDPLLNGPDGPLGSPIYGRAYPVGTALDDDRKPAILLAYEAPAQAGQAALCLATLRYGSPLHAAQPFQCSGKVPPDPLTAITFAPIEAGGYTVIDDTVKYVSVTRSDLLSALPRDTARAELIVIRTADLPLQPAGRSSALKAIGLPVTLLGADHPDMPALIGTVDPLPAGYLVIGVDAWNHAGQRTVHELTDSYCGGAAPGARRYPLSLETLRVSC